MAHLSERFRQIFEPTGLSLRAFGVRADLSEKCIRDLLKPDYGSPTLATINKIAAAFDISPAWLAFGVGSPAAQRKGRHIPVRGTVKAGLWIEADLLQPLSAPAHHIRADPRLPLASQFGMVLEDDSLNLSLKPGSALLCLDMEHLPNGRRIRDGDLVVIERMSPDRALREVSARRYQVTPAGPRLFTHSDRPRWAQREPLTLPPASDPPQLRIMALVLRSEREWWRG